MGVTGRAKVTLRVGLHAVLAQKVAVMDDVALGRRHLARKVDVTATAISRVPLPFVGVAAEASRMLSANIVGIGGYVDVTSHAVAGTFFAVRQMREAQMLASHLRRVAISRAPVAVRTGVGIVRFLVAFHAVRRGRKVQRPRVPRLLNAAMALQAVDPLDHVHAVLEGIRFPLLLETEHLGAGSSRRGKQNQSSDGDDVPHYCPCHVR